MGTSTPRNNHLFLETSVAFQVVSFLELETLYQAQWLTSFRLLFLLDTVLSEKTRITVAFIMKNPLVIIMYMNNYCREIKTRSVYIWISCIRAIYLVQRTPIIKLAKKTKQDQFFHVLIWYKILKSRKIKMKIKW